VVCNAIYSLSTDARPPVLLVIVSLAVVLADARPTRRIAWNCFFGCCARRYSTRSIACTGILGDCARRCSTRRIPCTCFFGGCTAGLVKQSKRSGTTWLAPHSLVNRTSRWSSHDISTDDVQSPLVALRRRRRAHARIAAGTCWWYCPWCERGRQCRDPLYSTPWCPFRPENDAGSVAIRFTIYGLKSRRELTTSFDRGSTLKSDLHSLRLMIVASYWWWIMWRTATKFQKTSMSISWLRYLTIHIHLNHTYSHRNFDDVRVLISYTIW
jgi:hypothetical protein